MYLFFLYFYCFFFASLSFRKISYFSLIAYVCAFSSRDCWKKFYHLDDQNRKNLLLTRSYFPYKNIRKTFRELSFLVFFCCVASSSSECVEVCKFWARPNFSKCNFREMVSLRATKSGPRRFGLREKCEIYVNQLAFFRFFKKKSLIATNKVLLF